MTPELEAELRSVTQDALGRHAARLELDGVDVALLVDPHWDIPELGLVGYAPQGHFVQLMVNPGNPNFERLWRRELPLHLGHELHHAKRWQGVGYGRTLLEALVSEGLAQHYEVEERGQPPIYAAAHADMAGLWQRAQTELHQPYDHNAWFFGSADRQLPRWAGYALGYELVQRFFAATGGDAVTHVNTPAETFAGAWAG
ncbi:hypothetical protein D3875_10885 [Deinococcus cavernae]|uniref:DUF2268 domain-containing protein n=2 Tax=Deinococcus cavernae TaxID=2320857 RepID=A0A418VC00_9DEIO|nr:hypothetical protein D3875_10885 [Deinococcus cavernae]